MARRDVEFDAEGVTLRGWFYPGEGAHGPTATVVLAHGFSAVKEMYLDSFGGAFSAAGLNALVFDSRNFGASDGEPRQEIDPWANRPEVLESIRSQFGQRMEAEDIADTITYIVTRPRHVAVNEMLIRPTEQER